MGVRKGRLLGVLGLIWYLISLATFGDDSFVVGGLQRRKAFAGVLAAFIAVLVVWVGS